MDKKKNYIDFKIFLKKKNHIILNNCFHVYIQINVFKIYNLKYY